MTMIISCKFRKDCFALSFYIDFFMFFHDFIHVYSPLARTDNLGDRISKLIL